MRLPNSARRLLVRGSRAWHRWRGPTTMRAPLPPRCPPGWQVGPPHFVGVGAQKAGTSWWNALIHEHPAVHRAGGQPKELHFFDALWERSWTDADRQGYWRHFPRPEGGVAGEWTPGYLIDFWTPGLLAAAAPEARILVLLRDPIERLRSGLTHQLSTSRTPLSHRDLAGAFARGLYAQQMRRVLDAFPREQVYVGQYEACRADPRRELERTFMFLGLAPVELPDGTFEAEVNPTTSRKLELSADLRAALIDSYASDLERLAGMLPGLDLSLWPTAREAGLA